MTGKRLWQTLRLWSMKSSVKRVNYLRRKHIFGEIGENVTIMDRRIPLYARLIRIHNNVRLASNVTFAIMPISSTKSFFAVLSEIPRLSPLGEGRLCRCAPP